MDSATAPSEGSMRFAYADPPYRGQAKKHYGDQPTYAGEVDHMEPCDTLDDLFPGTGAVSTAWRKMAKQTDLEVA